MMWIGSATTAFGGNRHERAVLQKRGVQCHKRQVLPGQLPEMRHLWPVVRNRVGQAARDDAARQRVEARELRRKVAVQDRRCGPRRAARARAR